MRLQHDFLILGSTMCALSSFSIAQTALSIDAVSPTDPCGVPIIARCEQAVDPIENTAQQMSLFPGPLGMRVEHTRANGQPLWLELKATGLGREGDVQPVSSPRQDVFGNRIEYARGNLVEWFLHDDGGLEHGFTISSPVESRDGSA